MTLIELTVALTVLAVIAAGTAQLLALAAHQERAVQRQLLAQQEAANTMERLFALPWDELSAGADAAEFSPHAQDRLPGGKLDVAVDEANHGPLEGRRIRVAVSWRTQTGQQGRPVELVAWRYRVAEDRP